MKVYTSYFGKMRKFPEDFATIAICVYPPDWFGGFKFEKFCPPEEVFHRYNGSEKTETVWDAFELEYKRKLKRLDAKRAMHELYSMFKYKKAIVLLCWETPDKHCHRHILARWFRHFGFDVKEWSEDNET